MKKFVLLFLSVLPVMAQVCNDQTPIYFGGGDVELSKTMSAVANLINAGADVRVRLVDHLNEHGVSTVDAYEQQVEKACSSWQAPGGGRKNNLIAVIVAPNDHKTGIYYGSEWARVLDHNYLQIETQVMNPRFRDGDIDDGIAAGLKEITFVIGNWHPGTSVIAPVISEPTDLSGLWRVLLFMTGGVIGLVLFVMFFKFFLAKVKKDEKRLAAQSDALAAQQEAASLVIEATNGLLANDATNNPTAKMLLNQAISAFGELGRGVSNPTCGTLVEDQYIGIARRYKDVSATIHRAQAIINGVVPQNEPTPATKEQRLENLVSSEPPTTRHDKRKYHGHSKTVYEDNNTMIVVPGLDLYGYNTPVFTPIPEPDTPVFIPTPDLGDSNNGGSTDFGSSSSDSGGSTDFGSSSSDSGGGGDSSW